MLQSISWPRAPRSAVQTIRMRSSSCMGEPRPWCIRSTGSCHSRFTTGSEPLFSEHAHVLVWSCGLSAVDRRRVVNTVVERHSAYAKKRREGCTTHYSTGWYVLCASLCSVPFKSTVTSKLTALRLHGDQEQVVDQEPTAARNTTAPARAFYGFYFSREFGHW